MNTLIKNIMPLTEFDIIKKYFDHFIKKRKDVLLGIGDDAAIIKIPNNRNLVLSVDTLVAGVHFPINTKPYDIGYKALAVNLSDLAAMGAEPAFCTLALTLPAAEKKWLKGFTAGFFNLLNEYNMQLVGGDITSGPHLTISVQVHGYNPTKKALLRSQAKPNDRIYVTGNLGDAGLALQLLQQNKPNIPAKLLAKLNRPTPRIKAGLALREIANSAIDISDGLSSDIKHILQASNMGATVWVDALPLSPMLKKFCPEEHAINFALSSGDDYELCFTVPVTKEKKLINLFNIINCPIHCIGIIEKKAGLRLQYKNGTPYKLKKLGFRHF